MEYPFSIYAFIKRECGNWVSLGWIKDDTEGDAMKYNYTLPNSKGLSVAEGEGLAIKMLADTAYLVCPATAPIHVKWKVSREETKTFIESNPDILNAILKVSTSFEICLMESEFKDLFEMEVATDDPAIITDPEE